MVKKWSVSYPAVNGTEQRRVYVYLPTMYEADPDRRYPVLYMFDGQNVFFDEDATFGKSWGVADYLDYTDTPHNSALWGELLTACGKARGAVGAVLDGYTRDTPKVIEQNFPVFCSGTWAQDSSVRTYVFKWRCPIEIGQVTIHNGDIVFGDIDGVLIIPKDIAPEVIEKALVKASTEKTMRKAIEDGMMVTDAFAKFGVL